MLVQLIGAKRGIEVGVYTGYSALSVLLVMPSDAKLVACDVNEYTMSIARRYFDEASVSDKVDIRMGDATKTLQSLLDNGEENRQRGHLGTDSSCPKVRENAKPKTLKTANLQEVAEKKGYWYIPSAQYAGWVFNDDLETPDWVWTLDSQPTPRPDIYPPYDSRWQTLKVEKKSPKCFTSDPMINVDSLKQEIWENDLRADLQSLQEVTEKKWVEAVRRNQELERNKEDLQKQRTYTRRTQKGQTKAGKGQGESMAGTEQKEGTTTLSGEATTDSQTPAVGGKRKHLERACDRDEAAEEQDGDKAEYYPWAERQENEILSFIHKFEKERQDKYDLQLILHREEQRNRQAAAANNPTQAIPLTENPFAPLEREAELAALLAEKYSSTKENQEMEIDEGNGNAAREKSQTNRSKLPKYRPTLSLNGQKEQQGQTEATA
ncbi:hypothetical protein CBR_g4503 [Chara braunii]|uniref:Caffeoyl-CoA O-methyltransferase n=1 Tax=Chara braunii TaxID=69332 RepID=A0A388KI02_CHABU|nr:hypothetical protein CBR_g4503 [Chara braunii]|eukprot:GBG69672.1 hypothetical protein CBR_g4503 [Chara braunii]